MNERIARMRQFFFVDKGQKAFRQAETDPYELAAQFEKDGVCDVDRAALRLCTVLDRETPVLFEDERIAFTRTVVTIPELFTEKEFEAIKSRHWIHEKGDVCNINVDYTRLLSVGFDAKKEELSALRADFLQKNEPEKAHYLELQAQILDAVQRLADRYRLLAERQGNKAVAETLSWVPAKAPRTFAEALQMFRILHFVMWCGRNYHNTIGRFDQYLFPYLQNDLRAGLLNEDSALELLEEFFLTFNRDSDLYPGMQQGDNGQSMVLGGRDENGRDCYNTLSELCLKASLDLKLIDPKINLRVHRGTPLSQFVLGTELTKQGLGFPQYCGDETVIPGLMKLGYSEKDACNYVVAACWEFIIPGRGMDIPNIEALSFAAAAEKTVAESLLSCEDYPALEQVMDRNIALQADEICGKIHDLYLFPAPFVSLMMEGCCETGTDISKGCVYNNFGLHGTGLSTAADTLAAVKQYVFDEKRVDKQTLLDALKHNFEGYDTLLHLLRFDAPKMGNHDRTADSIAAHLLDVFADALRGRTNERGGVWRAGTGSAMYYIWHGQDLPATADGRLAGEALPANYSPSLFARCKGPVSIIRSFTGPRLENAINGGPLTLELHDSVFRTPESVEKTAMLVKSFFDLGGHQLQLNAVNRDTLLDAQAHPEKYRNLIVRVWGWSGYFVELDKIYQDHIIKRMELQI